MAEYALRLANSTDTKERVRQGDTMPLFPVAPLQARNGLRRDGGAEVTVVAGTMGVQVTPFSGWVDGGTSDAQGGYVFVCDATKALTLSDGHASLSRTDTVVAQVQDDTHDASGATLAQVRVVEGTPGAGAPTLPDSCIPLRDITVPAGLSAGTGGLSSSNLATDRRTYTVAAGGILPVAGATERDALLQLGGSAVFREDTGRLEVFDGTTWNTFKRDNGLLTQRDTESMSTTGSSTVSTVVTFGTEYSSPPTVVASVASSQQRFYAQAINVTTSSCEIRAVDRDGTTSTGIGVDVSWIAIGPE